MIEQFPGTVAPNVPTPNYSDQPRNMRLTPKGGVSAPVSRRFPRIIGGQCEFCGTLDPAYPGDMQYKFCPHYRGMEARCVYCEDTKDPVDVVRTTTLNVAEHPNRPGEILMWCKGLRCEQRHREAFK